MSCINFYLDYFFTTFVPQTAYYPGCKNLCSNFNTHLILIILHVRVIKIKIPDLENMIHYNNTLHLRIKNTTKIQICFSIL